MAPHIPDRRKSFVTLSITTDENKIIVLVGIAYYFNLRAHYVA